MQTVKSVTEVSVEVCTEEVCHPKSRTDRIVTHMRIVVRCNDASVSSVERYLPDFNVLILRIRVVTDRCVT